MKIETNTKPIGNFVKKHCDIFLTSPLFFLVFFIGIIPFVIAFINGFYFDGWTQKYFVGLENYMDVLKDEGMFLSLKISVAYSFICTLSSVFLAFPISLTLNRSNCLSALLYIALLIPWGVPAYILVPVWRAVLHGGNGLSLVYKLLGINLNLLTNPTDSFLSAVFVSVWLVIPATAIVMLSAIRKINRNMIESAKMEGANSFDISFKIILPQIKSSVITISVLNFIKFFKEFTVIYLLTAGGAPLIDGITPTQIIGATTSSEIFIYNRFSLEDNFGLTSAYAGIMGLIICGFLILFFSVKRRDNGKDTGLNPNTTRYITLAAINLLLGNTFSKFFYAFIFAVLFLVNKKYGKTGFAVILILILQVVQMTFGICKNGILLGSDMAVIITPLLFLPEILRTAGAYFSKLKSGLNSIFFSVFRNFISGIFILLSALVIFILLYMSLSKYSTTYITGFLPETFTISNFKKVLFEEDIIIYFMNSLRLSLPVAAITPLLCLPTAFYMTKKSSKATNTLLAILSFTGVFGGMHTLIPLYAVFRQIQLHMSFIPLTLIYVFQSIPFSLFTIKSYLDSMPHSMSEFARLEGMGQFGYIFKIVLPLSLPAFFTAFMLSFLSAWNGFLAPLIFIDSENLYPISLKISSYVGSIASGNPKWNLFASLSILNMVIIIILFLYIKKPLKHTELSTYSD